MNNKEIYAITGLFDKPGDIEKAAKEANKAGYTKYDINVPYPVHNLSHKMKLKHSTLGWYALFFGLLGTSSALFFMWWVSAYDYPLNIGGKPFFPFPAFIPITFEITVLLASIGTVIGMIFVYFKLPNNRHPLNGTDYMKNVSSDKFGLCILRSDPLFDEQKINNFLNSLDAKDITPIYWDEDDLSFKAKFFDPRFVMFLIGVIVVTAGVTYFSMNIMLDMVPFSWMDQQHRLPAQTPTNLFEDGRSMRTPVEGTVARDFLPYPYTAVTDSTQKELANPLEPTRKNFELGEAKFNIYCSPCHGFHGQGDSRLNGQFPNPPSLQSEKIKNASDGIIYHIITVGQNVMPSYSKQLSREEKWAIVLHIRALQRAMDAKEDDLK
jgi:mono/diheme cytochrome c family protein